jgi:hypothetical protein
MTKVRPFRSDFLSFMTNRPVIFSEQGGSASPLKTAIIYRFKIFLLSKQFFRKKNTITEHKKAYSRILGITETDSFMPLLTTPTGAHGGSPPKERKNYTSNASPRQIKARETLSVFNQQQ